jgi:polyhydroxyalkanoate synthesis regulator phasin
MADFSNLVQKAFYLGVGLASYAGEKAGDTLSEFRGQAQKLVEELVERGELTAEEAQKVFNDMVSRAQQTTAAGPSTASEGPRRIEILDEDATASPEQQQAEELRRQVEALRDELRHLKED